MHPDSLVGSAQLDRALRTRRLRRAAAIIAWLAIVAIIVLIVFVGGRPAPTGFQS